MIDDSCFEENYEPFKQDTVLGKGVLLIKLISIVANRAQRYRRCAFAYCSTRGGYASNRGYKTAARNNFACHLSSYQR